jgi:hypothetical protein
MVMMTGLDGFGGVLPESAAGQNVDRRSGNITVAATMFLDLI